MRRQQLVIDDTGSVEDIHAFIYCKKWRSGEVLPMPDWQTTLKDRATQLLTKYKSGALVTQFILMKKIEWEDDLRKGRNFPPSGWNSGTLQLTSPTHRATTGFPASRSRSNTSIDLTHRATTCFPVSRSRTERLHRPHLNTPHTPLCSIITTQHTRPPVRHCIAGNLHFKAH